MQLSRREGLSMRRFGSTARDSVRTKAPRDGAVANMCPAGTTFRREFAVAQTAAALRCRLDLPQRMGPAIMKTDSQSQQDVMVEGGLATAGTPSAG
jgi:cobyric acid synthase